ncbi:MAG TPA: inorganic triphosphatase [Pasteurellaceae bacterium]|nr:inorganic triphosphatase [Pasteurellaceae bacterium]
MLRQFKEVSLPAEDLCLQPVFDTNFERHSWLIECHGGTEIEVALDRGDIKADGKIEPICEVEFELKQGKLDDLLTFVSGLSLTDGIRLSSASKAKRGYRLAGLLPLNITDWLDKWHDIIKLGNNADEKTQEKLTALFNYEQQLIEETLAFGADYFARDFMLVVERISAFFNLYHYYADNRKLLDNALQERLADSPVQLDEQALLELSESNTYLLEQIHNLIRQHSENKDNATVMNKLSDLLHTGQYVKRMINLIKLTVK